MTDQQWTQTPDGQWVPVNQPGNPKAMRVVVIIILALGVLMVPMLIVGAISSSRDDQARTDTVDRLDTMWAGLPYERRLGVCSDVRDAGVTAAADAFKSEIPDIDRDAVAGWLRERCGD